jgi:hypothetical protein
MILPQSFPPRKRLFRRLWRPFLFAGAADIGTLGCGEGLRSRRRKWERIGYFGTFKPKRNNYGLKIPLGKVKRMRASFAANEATRALGANAQRRRASAATTNSGRRGEPD